MNGSLVTDLGLGPEVWLFLSLLGCVTLFFKFSRFWSVRNLDLLLLFVLAPGMMLIVSNPRPSAVECLHLAVPGVGALAGSVLGRPGAGASAASGAEPERLGTSVPVGGRAGLAAGRDVSLPVEEGPPETRPSPRDARTRIGRGGAGQTELRAAAGDRQIQGIATSARSSTRSRK